MQPPEATPAETLATEDAKGENFSDNTIGPPLQASDDEESESTTTRKSTTEANEQEAETAASSSTNGCSLTIANNDVECWKVSVGVLVPVVAVAAAIAIGIAYK